MSVKLIAPQGSAIPQIVWGKSGTSYTPAADGTISNVNYADVGNLLLIGWTFYRTQARSAIFEGAKTADLILVKAAATPANGAITIAAQPPHARKLAIRIVIGTTTTTAITAGTLTLVGVDQDGNTVTEVISLIQDASATVKSANAYASLTSGTVAGYTAAGSGTGNTLGIGLAADFGLPTELGAVNFAVHKCTKLTKVLGTSVTAADDVAASGTVDATARTFAPTTAQDANGLIDYNISYTYGAGT